MHPVIRILCLLIAAGFLARGGWPQLGLLAALLAGLYLAAGQGLPRRLLRTLARLRFLFLSIAIVYLWFTPGMSIWPRLGAWSPTWSGLSEGAVRVAALVVLMGAVHLLMATTGRERLLGAIRWWARPLALLGLSPDRLALRMVLTLEAVPRLREVVQGLRARKPAGSRLGVIGHFAGGVYAATLTAADQVEPPAVALPELAQPAPPQWLLPLGLAAALAWV